MRLSRHPGFIFLACIALFVAGGGTVLYGFSTLGYGLPFASTAIPISIGVALVAVSIAVTRATERQLHAEELRALEEKGPSAAPVPAGPPRAPAVPRDAVLGEWTLEPYEWLAFASQEADRKQRGAFGNALIGAVGGAMATYVVVADRRYTIAGAVLAAIAAVVGTLVAARRTRTRAPRAGAAVVVRRNAVEIDGATEVLRDDEWWLSGAKLRDDLPLPILELTVKRTRHERGGSRRTVEQVVRVPVPRGREPDARRIADELRGGTVDDPDDD
jgi:uncharacterized membrane protein YeaQ/YmgE (transglycosylase-associated protein family)